MKVQKKKARKKAPPDTREKQQGPGRASKAKETGGGISLFGCTTQKGGE